ncbi:hypothetical protein J2S19_003963 [Metabacillus malikii]|uniref:Uncharacterized protein n=1 Tax=Metabacillus malikii TaxID=1504265 RepID=A0ABT9ZLH7_9BACI|nr:hypothetical protein [Metabacillus malikii]
MNLLLIVFNQKHKKFVTNYFYIASKYVVKGGESWKKMN